MDELLPARLKEGHRSFHDAVVRQLSTGGAPERGQLLTNSIELFDTMILPLALDEIGMCGDPATAAKLLRLAEGEMLPEGSDYLRVKAIEALGRMRSTAAAGHLRHFVESRKTFGWAYPEEIRMAAAQALMKLDPDVDASVPAAVRPRRGSDGARAARRDSRTRFRASPPLPPRSSAAQRSRRDHVGSREIFVGDQRAEPRWADC